jgi:hypothetical protein
MAFSLPYPDEDGAQFQIERVEIFRILKAVVFLNRGTRRPHPFENNPAPVGLEFLGDSLTINRMDVEEREPLGRINPNLDRLRLICIIQFKEKDLV